MSVMNDVVCDYISIENGSAATTSVAHAQTTDIKIMRV